MTQNFRTLVKIIRQHFSKQSYVADGPLLASLFETAFLASTITDEGRNVTCSISVFDPHQTINDAPEMVRADRWAIIPLADSIPFTPEHLARISQAIRPHAGALGVRPAPDGGWSIWAIIDQEHLIRGFRQHKSVSIRWINSTHELASSRLRLLALDALPFITIRFCSRGFSETHS